MSIRIQDYMLNSNSGRYIVGSYEWSAIPSIFSWWNNESWATVLRGSMMVHVFHSFMIDSLMLEVTEKVACLTFMSHMPN